MISLITIKLSLFHGKIIMRVIKYRADEIIGDKSLRKWPCIVEGQ